MCNTLHYDLFAIDLPDEVSLVGFADDIVLLTTVRIECYAYEYNNNFLETILQWMSARGLKLAHAKKEAVLLTPKSKHANIL